MSRQVNFFFFLGSTYTYLTVMRIEKTAARANIGVRWRPFNIRAIMTEQGNIPFRDKPVKLKYMRRDIERRAFRYGIPFGTIPPYPVDPDTLGNRVAVLAAQEGWCPQYTQAAYCNWFLNHRVPDDSEHLIRMLRELKQNPADVIERANSQEIRDRFDAETDVARELGIFGSPTFLVGNEIFWGDDRLEDAIEWANSHDS